MNSILQKLLSAPDYGITCLYLAVVSIIALI